MCAWGEMVKEGGGGGGVRGREMEEKGVMG